MARTYKRDARGRFSGGGGGASSGGGSGGSGKGSAAPANKKAASPRRMTSDEKKVAKVMGDKSLRSDRQRLAALREMGFKGDAVATFASVRQKLGVAAGAGKTKGMTSPDEIRKTQKAAVKKFNDSAKPPAPSKKRGKK